jgi:hypothetical protein
MSLPTEAVGAAAALVQLALMLQPQAATAVTVLLPALADHLSLMLAAAAAALLLAAAVVLQALVVQAAAAMEDAVLLLGLMAVLTWAVAVVAGALRVALLAARAVQVLPSFVTPTLLLTLQLSAVG